MEYVFYIESNKPKALAYAIPVYNPEKREKSKFVESGFGLYKFEKGLEVIKQNGNIVADDSDTKEQSEELAQLLLSRGLPKEQISYFLMFA